VSAPIPFYKKYIFNGIFTATAFDVHISEITQSWLLGTRLLSAPTSRFALLADLQYHLIHLGITHLGMVPSMIEATLTKNPDELPLKYLVSGGEKISDNVCLLFYILSLLTNLTDSLPLAS
jgi:non-ribosomal peptide synthetase component F